MRHNLTKLDDDFKTWSSSKLNAYLQAMAQKINLLSAITDTHEEDIRSIRLNNLEYKKVSEELKDELSIAKNLISDLGTHHTFDTPQMDINILDIEKRKAPKKKKAKK